MLPGLAVCPTTRRYSDAPVLTFRGRAYAPYGWASYTWSGVPIGPAESTRRVLILATFYVTWGYPTFTVTAGGVAVPNRAMHQMDNGSGGIYSLGVWLTEDAVPGSTADIYLASSLPLTNHLMAAAYSVTNLRSPYAVDSAAINRYAPYGQGNTWLDLSLDVPPGGIAVAQALGGSYLPPDTVPSYHDWSGLNEVFDDQWVDSAPNWMDYSVADVTLAAGAYPQPASVMFSSLGQAMAASFR